MTSVEAHSEYKETGLKWLGRVPASWGVVPLWTLYSRGKSTNFPEEELLSVYRDHGVVPKSSRDDNFNKPSEDLSAYQLVRPGDMVINKMKAWQGSVAISRHRGIVSPAYFVYERHHTMDDRYLHYLLRSERYITGYLSLSKGIRINQWDLDPTYHSRMPVLVPSMQEQRAIVSLLDRETTQIDTLIAKQERLIELLAEKRQAIITRAITKGLDPAAPTKPSGIPWLGETPSHWKVGPVKHFYDIVLGKMLQREQEVDTDARLPYLKAASIRSGTISLFESNQMWFSKDEVASLSLRSGDVLVVEGGSIGQSALVDEDMAGIGFEKSLNRVRPKTGSTAEYFQHYMTMARESGYVAMQCVGATFMHLTSEKLGRMVMPFPPEHEQRQIASNIEQHLLRLENASSKGRRLIDLLRERRSALISAAVTGKIDVTNEGVTA